MSHLRNILLFIFSILNIMVGCNAQNTDMSSGESSQPVDRKPVVAGQFYPADPYQLKEMLKQAFDQAKKNRSANVQAIIVPHAGYVFSASVAASAYSQLDPNKKYENIFILGSSHYASFEGASVYNIGNYETPLGEVKVNTSLASRLIGDSPVFSFVPQAHSKEHSLEVQLPFLQYLMKQPFQIVPIVIGTHSKKVCQEIAASLKPFFNKKNLFIISSDFSHYPPYEDANKLDRETAEAIASNDPNEFLSTIQTHSDDDVPNLATRACGWTSILTLLYLTKNDNGISYQRIAYKNSADSEYGDKNRVVGYNAIVATRNSSGLIPGFHLSDADKKFLLKLSRSTLKYYFKHRELPAIDTGNISPEMQNEQGAFVTLNKDHELRGCIGTFIAQDPLYRVVQDMSLSAAFNDRRFYPLTQSELPEVEIEISVLSPLRKIDSISEIQLGRDGIYIKKGNHTGTFLPQVAVETGWTLEEFLGHCSRDKAGIGWEGWKDADIFVYQAEVFSESEFGLH